MARADDDEPDRGGVLSSRRRHRSVSGPRRLTPSPARLEPASTADPSPRRSTPSSVCSPRLAWCRSGPGRCWRAQPPQPSRLTRIRPLMEHVRDTDDNAYFTRSREMAFLANTLMAGCSVQSRPFTAQEASDAAVGICNLGLEHWPARWPDARRAMRHRRPTSARRCLRPFWWITTS